jgi:hypothetical protein
MLLFKAESNILQLESFLSKLRSGCKRRQQQRRVQQSTIFRFHSGTLSALDVSLSVLDGTLSPLDGTLSALDGTLSALDRTLSPLDGTFSALDRSQTNPNYQYDTSQTNP